MSTKQIGKVVQCIGAVVDVEFPRDQLPKVYDALIIDEVGVQFGSDTEKMIVFDIIDGRYSNMLPTILISNLALPDVKELIGERAIDRLREDGGVVVAMKWDSNRGK
jgi:DNA replication protein DnaC